jgi:hypothetical protein
MKIIPITKLRNFYKSLAELRLSTKTQLNIVEDFNRKENYKQLISWYKESKNHFAEYKNIDDPFLPNNLDHRRKVPNNVKPISSTQGVIAVFHERNREIVVDDSGYNFKYIQREVPTYRTTNTKSEVGRKSGSGGIDFIGYNCKNFLPILGEIKVKSDQNPFYALIQLLTYLSELSTTNQIKRINKYKLLGDIPDLTDETSFYLYILLVFEQLGDKKNELLNKTRDLAEKLEKPHIQEIEKIVFLKMHPETKKITNLRTS